MARLKPLELKTIVRFQSTPAIKIEIKGVLQLMDMDEAVFQECLSNWKISLGNSSTTFWPELAKKFNYETTEQLRSQFKRERIKRGISKTEQRTVQQNPIVGVVDIETLPIKLDGYIWGIRDQYLTYDMVGQDSHMLSWAGKYLHSSQMYSDVMKPSEAKKYDSKRITISIMKFLNTCDIVIGHNWSNFDGKIVNSELMYYELNPVKYRAIDTYTLLKSHFRETSYKLADINKKYGIRDKISNEGMPLWRKCAEGDEEALATMLNYNEGDILATESLFWKIQPYVNNSIPNFGTYQDGVSKACHCGSSEFTREKMNWFTNQAEYERFRCNNCGAVHRGKKNLLSKEKRASIMVRL